MKNPWFKTLQRIDPHNSILRVFDDFVRMVACTLSNQTREEQYLAVVKRYTRPQVELFCEAFGQLILEMESQPFTDVLGPVYMQLGSQKGKQMGGEFYTPVEVCHLMAKLTFTPPRPGQIESFCDPAGGSGGMALAHARCLVEEGCSVLCTQVVLWDISSLATDMAYINMTLWGIPATVVHGNTLTQEVFAVYQNVFWNMARPQDPLFEALAAVLGLLKQDVAEQAPEQPQLMRPSRALKVVQPRLFE